MSELAIPTSLLGLTIERHGAGAVVTVSGEIDLSTRREFEVHLDKALDAVSPPETLVVDLSEVTFLGSAGLALLLNTQKTAARRGTPLRVVATQRAVRRPVEAVGLSDALPLHGTVESALAGVPAPRTGEEILDFTLDADPVSR
ncbi:anti-anti-sigma factor [Saccharomonospora piscinae]|uniref:Anti-sigma factor antagonist n=1 Tax=Saccharomonospora piscinae TaxID=687388 RepID=A0A1V8ZWT6_SACPI|nr:STAS domain-containing protein [Saccharomonospora piscinae]OQO89379.1 anti-anti-sigma factor [Saccharomonospora piscinae]TLW91071.1 STAS domain-containing protein [Saccharomonospora piscinae]